MLLAMSSSRYTNITLPSSTLPVPEGVTALKFELNSINEESLDNVICTLIAK
jgi:hypothetical protein